MAIAKGDFIAIDFTARTQATADTPAVVFDTTKENVARAAGLYNPERKYGSIGICVGAGFVLPALDSQLIGREANSSFTLKIMAAQAFGLKDAKLIRLIPMKKFKESQTMPQIGLTVVIDGVPGVVKTVGSGRVFVDFNHPQAGKDIEYAVNIGHIITDQTQQLLIVLGSQFKDTVGYVENNVATVTFPQELPKEIYPIIEAQIKKMMPSLTSVTFKTNVKSAAPVSNQEAVAAFKEQKKANAQSAQASNANATVSTAKK